MGQFFCPMLKADAYGHGAKELARFLKGVQLDGIGVHSVEEALDIKEVDRHRDVYVYSPVLDRHALAEAGQHQLILVVSSWEEIRFLESEGWSGAAHLKINTGMNRLGFAVDDSKRLADWMVGQTKIRVQGLLTHLSQGEDLNFDGLAPSLSHTQLKEFYSVISGAPGLRRLKLHAFNSPGHKRLEGCLGLSPKKEGLFEFAMSLGSRPGMALYAPDHAADSIESVMKIESKIVALQPVAKGSSVSYGETWRADRKSLIGVVGIGYADGVRRHLSNRGFFAIHGQRVPIVGRVCMDFTLVDLTDLEQRAQVGDTVEVLGSQILACEVAQWSDTIHYEVLCGISKRVQRQYHLK